jgi:Uma2 family endonuclease
MSEILTEQSEELLAYAPDISHLVTEDDTPVDNLFSEKQMRLLAESLYASWPGPGDDRQFVVMANVGLFYTTRSPALVPDVLLSVDVSLPDNLWPKEHRSYFIWEYGKPPDVVIEIVSNRKGRELGDKLLDYARLGVVYYVVYDPEQQISERPLRIFSRSPARYLEMDGTWLAEVNLGLTLWTGEYEGAAATWLRWCTSDGELVATGREASLVAAQRAQEAEQSAALAEQSAALAEQSAALADERAQEAERNAAFANERAARLAARLAALGIDPDA